MRSPGCAWSFDTCGTLRVLRAALVRQAHAGTTPGALGEARAVEGDAGRLGGEPVRHAELAQRPRTAMPALPETGGGTSTGCRRRRRRAAAAVPPPACRRRASVPASVRPRRRRRCRGRRRRLAAAACCGLLRGRCGGATLLLLGGEPGCAEVGLGRARSLAVYASRARRTPACFWLERGDQLRLLGLLALQLAPARGEVVDQRLQLVGVGLTGVERDRPPRRVCSAAL